MATPPISTQTPHFASSPFSSKNFQTPPFPAILKKSTPPFYVLNQHKAICCDHCNQWVHIKCNDLNDLDYDLLKSKNEFWYCILCTSEILPFSTVNSIMSLSKGDLNKHAGALMSLIN